MKTSFLHKIFNVILSTLIVVSSLSFTIQKHYCGDHLVDTTLFSNLKDCSGHHSQSKTLFKKSCCKNTIDVVVGDTQFKTSDNDISTQLDLDYFNFNIKDSEHHYVEFTFEKIVLNYYDPPIISKQSYLIYESFLI